MKTNISLVYIAVLMAMIMPASAAPDLYVESVALDCGYLFGNESNGISAKITNNGTDCNSSFDVSFVLSDGFNTTESVDAIASGNNTTVTITDPTIRNAGDSVIITVTADCYNGITEGNESNNATTLDATVVNNGYKGKTYTGGENITTRKTFDLNGDLVYSAGDSYYLSAYYNKHWTEYSVNWTASDLLVPAAATVVDARLYVPYTYDKADVMPDNVSLDFNGIAQTRDAYYYDEKMYSTTSYPYGMLAYNVTDDFNADGNSANLTNSHSGGGNVSMRGMMLVVTYEDASEPRRQIFVNEGFDMLYGGSGQCTTPEEATAWAPITGPTIDRSNASARLITYAPGADPAEGELIFNGQVWADEWTDNELHQIGISDRDVTAHLQQVGNVVGFQSSDDYMEASNAYLVIKYVGDVVSGDVTGNSVVNLGDAVLLFNWVSFPNERETTYALTRADNADVTGNGVVNLGDAVLLFNWVSFPNERETTYVLK